MSGVLHYIIENKPSTEAVFRLGGFGHFSPILLTDILSVFCGKKEKQKVQPDEFTEAFSGKRGREIFLQMLVLPTDAL